MKPLLCPSSVLPWSIKCMQGPQVPSSHRIFENLPVYKLIVAPEIFKTGKWLNRSASIRHVYKKSLIQLDVVGSIANMSQPCPTRRMYLIRNSLYVSMRADFIKCTTSCSFVPYCTLLSDLFLPYLLFIFPSVWNSFFSRDWDLPSATEA